MRWPWQATQEARRRDERRAHNITKDTIDAASVKAQAELLVKEIRAKLDKLESDVIPNLPDDVDIPEPVVIPELPDDLPDDLRGDGYDQP